MVLSSCCFSFLRFLHTRSCIVCFTHLDWGTIVYLFTSMMMPHTYLKVIVTLANEEETHKRVVSSSLNDNSFRFLISWWLSVNLFPDNYMHVSIRCMAMHFWTPCYAAYIFYVWLVYRLCNMHCKSHIRTQVLRPYRQLFTEWSI